jgi:hypothetical protein
MVGKSRAPNEKQNVSACTGERSTDETTDAARPQNRVSHAFDRTALQKATDSAIRARA